MNTSGEAAEQVMRMSLEGAEILIKLTGSGAKNAAVLLYSIYKEQNKTRGKERLTNMLRSGKPLKVYTFKRDNLEKFKEVAKEYGMKKGFRCTVKACCVLVTEMWSGMQQINFRYPTKVCFTV